jgi:DNA-binding response OmpR family regulator
MLKLRAEEAVMAHRILLVDDDDLFHHACGKVITGAGYLVEHAPDYREALPIIDDDQPLALLVTDVVMPNGVNGFALARMARIRRVGIKVLYLTGFDVPTIEANGKILRKPIADELLLAEIGACLVTGEDHSGSIH